VPVTLAVGVLSKKSTDAVSAHGSRTAGWLPDTGPQNANRAEVGLIRPSVSVRQRKLRADSSNARNPSPQVENCTKDDPAVLPASDLWSAEHQCYQCGSCRDRTADDELKGQIQTAYPHLSRKQVPAEARYGPAVMKLPRWPSLAASTGPTRIAAMAKTRRGRCGSREQARQDCSLLPWRAILFRQASGQTAG